MAAFGSGGFGNQSGFGQSSSAFGGNAFGSNTGPFGGQSAFGSQSSSLFASQPQSFSSFGQSAPFGASSFGAQSAPAFGSSFGSQSTSAFGSGFGAPSSAAFGASSAFGSGSSLFGSNRPPTSGFGSSNPFSQSQSAWGQSSSAFGGSSAFGSSGGVFGNSGASSSVLGQPPSSFGGSSQGQRGTAGISWQITTEYDAGQGQGPSKYQSITMMNQLRSKSLEELRVEDYAAGNKGGNQGGMAGGFSNAQSGGLFGSSGSAQTGGFGSGNVFGSASGFGQSSGAGVFGGGGFGASSGFGQQSSSGFGGSGAFGAQSGGGLFAQSSSAFGAQSSGGFGNNSNTVFGSSSGLGSNPQSGGLLGSGGSGFGSTQQQQPAFGGSNTQSGLFGSSFQPPGNTGFGSNAQQTTPSLFANNAGNQSLFGASASGFAIPGAQKPLFGSTGGNSFGGAAFGSAAPGNTGGAPFGGGNVGQSAGNAFGFGGPSFGQQPAQQVQAQVPNGLGSSVVQGQAYGVMGNVNNPSLQGTFAAVTQQHGATVAPPGANYGTVLYNLQKLQSEIGEHNKLLEKQAKPNIPAPQPPDAVSVVVLPPPSPFGYPRSARGPSMSGYKWAGSTAQRTKMRGVAGRIGGPAARISGTPIPSSPDGDKEQIPATPARPSTDIVRRMSFFSPQNFSELRRSNTVRPSELPAPIPTTPKMLPLPEGYGRRSSGEPKQNREASAIVADEPASGEELPENPVSRLYHSSSQKTFPSAEGENSAPTHRETPHMREDRRSDRAIVIGANSEPETKNTTRRRSRSSSEGGSNDGNFVWARQRPSSWSLNRPVDSDDQYNPHKYLPSQTRSGFYTVPSLAELASQTMAELQQVENFTVGREGYGEITWVDPVDVRGLNLDAVVDIQHGEVAVYPEKEAEQLDAPARVKLEGMFAKRKKAGEVVSDAELTERYKQKLRNYCGRNDLRFIDYIPTKGEWLFEVRTFAD